MTTTTPSRGPDRLPISRRMRRGFTLVEVMIGATISSFVLAGVLSAYLFIVRSGVGLVNYAEMEQEARNALELFAQDTRQASAITWNSKASVTLTVDSAYVVYQYNSNKKTFERLAAGETRTILEGISAFEFKAFSITGAEINYASDLAAASRQTKQLQLSLSAARTNTTVVRATNTVLSARFILRNKRVTS